MIEIDGQYCDICVGVKLCIFEDDDMMCEFEYLNDDGSLGSIYNIDCENNALFCKNCGRFYMNCENCGDENNIVLCQFLGCANLPPKHGIVDHTIPYFQQEFDEGCISFENKNINYVKNEDIELITKCRMTGPDGGGYLFWRCRQCGKNKFSCDK